MPSFFVMVPTSKTIHREKGHDPAGIREALGWASERYYSPRRICLGRACTSGMEASSATTWSISGQTVQCECLQFLLSGRQTVST